jgi:two-component system response regulator
MRPRSILLVEDNVDDEFLTRRALSKAGITAVAFAPDGQVALDMLLDPEQPLPEMLILDLRLPKIHGLTLLAELRRHNRTMSLPVLILSSSDDPKDRQSCIKLGALAFFGKPLALNDLQQVFCEI